MGVGVSEPVVTVARSKTFNARGDSVISQENRVSACIYTSMNICSTCVICIHMLGCHAFFKLYIIYISLLQYVIYTYILCIYAASGSGGGVGAVRSLLRRGPQEAAGIVLAMSLTT